jgi:hypothetical protein
VTEIGPRANPLAQGPLASKADLQRAVRDLYEPLAPHTSPGGARVRLGSFGAAFEASVAELEGFSRPLYGIVPLTVGGGRFDHWDRVVAGLEAGTDPGSEEYWGPVTCDGDQRMVEQAAIGAALAFCPEAAWEPLAPGARDRLVRWLHGIFEHDPSPNNWQFFRVLVALGLERVGAPFDAAAVRASLDLLDGWRRGRCWYVDGVLETVDYYVPWAFHTYGLLYAAAATLGLGDPARAEAFRERAAAFATDFRHWFAPDGAAIPIGRSLTYRFAMASFWGALAWADVEPACGWGTAKGILLRHLRWWARKPISDRDGVLSVGFAYDNRRLRESYNSPCSPYWCMKAFGALAAPDDHPFWTTAEAPLAPLDQPVTLPEAGWVVTRDGDQAVALVARRAKAVPFPEQAAAKYGKFAYSSAFGFSGDLPDGTGTTLTDSMLALTDGEGNRRVRAGARAAGVEGGLAWSTWHPWRDVRVDTVCWTDATAGAAWHGRLHVVRTGRPLRSVETGFAVGYEPDGWGLPAAGAEAGAGRAVLRTAGGCSALVALDGRLGTVHALAVDANLLLPHTAVPALRADLEPGEHRLSCLVFASPAAGGLPDEQPAVPAAATELLERIAGEPS